MIDRHLKRTAIGRDFLNYDSLKKEQPCINKFLDYRNALTKGTHKNFNSVPKAFIDVEIIAVDEILKRIT